MLWREGESFPDVPPGASPTTVAGRLTAGENFDLCRMYHFSNEKETSDNEYQEHPNNRREKQQQQRNNHLINYRKKNNNNADGAAKSNTAIIKN